MSDTHRTTRILAHLAANPGGCSNADIVALVHRTEPDVKPVLISTLAHYLVRTGKLTTTGSHTTRRFYPVPDAPADRRVRATAATPRSRPAAAKKASDPALAKAPVPASTGLMDSCRIARDIAAFKRRGGRIEKLPAGASATPLGGDHSDNRPRPGASVRALIRAQIDNL